MSGHWTMSKRRALGAVAVITAVLLANAWSGAPLMAHPAHSSGGTPPTVSDAVSQGHQVATPVTTANGSSVMSCNGTVPPSATPLAPATRAQAQADMARLRGAAFANAHADFTLVTGANVVQPTTDCAGIIEVYSGNWGGMVDNQVNGGQLAYGDQATYPFRPATGKDHC